MIIAILLLPLLSFVGVLVAHYIFSSQKNYTLFSTALLALSLGCAALIAQNCFTNGTIHEQYTWFQLGNLRVKIGFLIDNLAALMLLVVTFISFLVHLFSLSYMHTEKDKNRYFACLGLFTFSMLWIVLADNLLQLFMGWELVGLSSYLLIGFWYQKDSAAAASKKAFVVNRIGDAGFLVAIMIAWSQFNTFEIAALDIAQLSQPLAALIGLGLLLAAMGKSAQFPLHVWLPDAMEGPTPVSALIHAATMVAAGVYLLARTAGLLIDVQIIVATVGAITLLLGAFSALRQHDIKKVLAYSTVSQLGYMVLAIGTQNSQAGLFHLFTHAFFKAGLFLAAGAVIHAIHEAAHHSHHDIDAQDMRNMGALRKAMPLTFVCYTICMLALAGLPLFTGFLSKDAILLGAMNWATQNGQWYIPIAGFVGAVLTPYYMGRQFFQVFMGKSRLPETMHVHEIDIKMKLPLVLLAFLSIGIVLSFNPVHAEHGWFVSLLGDLPHYEHYHTLVPLLSVGLVVIGLTTAYLLHKNYKTEDTNSTWVKITQNSFYLDALNAQMIVKPVMQVAQACLALDKKIIDGVIHFTAKSTVVLAHLSHTLDRLFVDGLVKSVATTAQFMGSIFRSWQNGLVQQYIVWTLTILLISILVINA